MQILEYIEKAEKKAGKQIDLAKILGISDGYIRMVKAGKRGFSNEISIILADYIEADRLEVIAASSLVNEKDENKRKIFESCFRKVAGVAAAAVLTSIVTLPSTSPANAQEISSDLQKYKLLAIYDVTVTEGNGIFWHCGSIGF